MLSVENPPRDPSQISQLKSSSSDEKASDKLQPVDLLNSDLDDNNSHPPPNFSIRDYVFNTRSKDIKNNWPFSQENLQLCLKHDVTDVLPPFQSPDTVRNPSLKSCSSDSVLNQRVNISNFNGEPSGQSDNMFVDSKSAGCNPNIAVDCLNTNSSGSEGDKEFPSTVTSQSSSDIDSVPAHKSPILESETDILPELSVAKPEAVSSAPNKTENTTQAPAKKCRLLVKLSNIANSSAKEDTAVNNFMVSEAMASKVCPVCKTFSSSSNTTLNAHIDQCLSGESTTKWTTNSTVIKHRIKPRKMKSMVEIYVTAPHCTLEELDRRNGTSWATNLSVPAQEIDATSDQKKEGSCHSNPEETPDEGAVYIDAHGTKLRILSKSNDPLFSRIVDGPRPKKLMDRDKVNKILSAKKKKQQNQVQKHHKLLKHGKKICSPQLHDSSEINDNQSRHVSGDETLENEGCMTQQLKAQAQVEFSRPDIIQGWACSKRSDLTKKIKGRNDHQRSRNYDKGDLRVENDQFSLGNPHVNKICGRRTPNIFENAISSPDSSKRVDSLSRYPHDEFRGQLRKRVALSSVEPKASHDRKKLGFPNKNVKRLRSDEPPNRDDDVSLLSKRKVKINSGPDRNADRHVIEPKLSAGHRTILSRARRLSSLRKKLSSGRASVPDSKFNLKRKSSSFKNSRVHCIFKSNEEAVSGMDREHLKQNPGEDRGRVRRTCDIGSLDRTGVLKIRKSGGGVMDSREEDAMPLKASQSVSKSFHRDVLDHDDSFMFGSVSACRSDVEESAEQHIHTPEKDFDTEPPSEVPVGEAFVDFRNSLDNGFHRLAGSSDVHCDSEQFIEGYKEPPPFEAEAPTSSADEPMLSGGREMFSAAEVPENMIRDNVHVLAELDSSDGHGNYFVDVDPIPIPGPPGSFLPSPGHMDSEDLQGNSSLNSSRVQSSDDHQELVDHSSDSPVSAISTISNSTLARSDSKSSGKLSVGCPSVPDEMRSGFVASANGCDPVVENSSPVFMTNDAGMERISLDELKVNPTITEKGAFRFKSDQPCCCSRKEGFSQNVSLNYQESQLLRRRNMAAAVVPASGKAMTGDMDSLRSEMSPVSVPSSGSETAMKSPIGHIPCRIFADSEVKFSSHDFSESNSPPPSNPVLRLMGKNLMVVNKDENVSPQLKASLSSMIGLANPQVVSVSGVSAGNVQNGNQISAHHVVSPSPFCFGQTESSKPVMQHPEMRWSDSLGSHENPGTPCLASPTMLSSRDMGSLMHHEYIAGYNFPTEQRQSLKRPGPSITCDVDNVVKNPNLRWRNANPPANKVKEVIVIDDTPENEVDSTTVVRHEDGIIQGMGSSSSTGKSMTMASACDSRPASTFHSYRQYESATYSGSPVDASFWMPSSNGVNESPVKWNFTPEGSSALHVNPLMITSSSTAQLRSKLYTSSNF